MKSIKNLFTVAVVLLFIQPTLQAREISFAAQELMTDFSQVANFSLYSNIDSADVDGDGDQDIIVSQFDTVDQISWLENDGGDFTDFPVHVISTATQSFKALQVIDLDQDGDQDVVGIDKSADELLWFENDGSGTTWTSHSIQQGTSTNSANDLSVTDIDADGDLDIVVAADDSFKLYWYENNGAASSWIENDTGIVTAGAVATLSTGDFTLDGTTDIVYALSSGSPYIEIISNSNGDGSSWATSTVATGSIGSINDIQVADLDLDGLIEIYYNQFNNDLTKLTFDVMTSTWSSSTVISLGTQGKTQFADIDNDGDLDVMSGSNTDFSWHENTDGFGGTWTEHILITGLANRVDSAHVVDLDDDGDMDIVLTKSEDGFVYAFNNLLFHSKAQIDLSSVLDNTHTNATHVITGQFNGDQYPDMITANSNASGLEVFFYAGDANANYSSKTTIINVSSATDSNISALASGDLDGDGDLDLAFAADGSDSIYSIENLMNSGPFSASKSLGNNQIKGANWGSATLVASASGKSEEIQIADINADGKQDIVVLSRLTNQVLWLSNDGAWTQTIISSASNSSTNLKVADMDNNGSLDVVTGSASGVSQWFSNDNGDGSAWTATTISSFAPYQLDLADMDNDGDLDVAFSGSFSQNIRWAENNGNGSVPWTVHDTSIATAFSTLELHTQDIDLDGDIDILLQTTNNDLILIESIDVSTDLWQESTVITGLNSPKSFVFSDYDRDGDIDIVSKGTTTSEMIKIENRGGQFSTDIISAPAQNSEDSQTVAVVDLTLTHNGRDADGDLQPTDLHLGFLAGTVCGGGFMAATDFNPLVETIGFYVDDGDGIFNQFVDSLITSQSGPFTLINGQIILPLTDINGDSNIVPDTVIASNKEFFVTLKYRPTASSQACNSLSVYVLQPNPTYSLDTLNAQDVDSGLDLTRAYSEITMPGEQTIIASTNNAPTTTGIASQNALVSLLFSVDISADFTDSDGDALFFTANGLPSSLTMNGNTGVISGTPTTIEANNSPFTVNVIAKDPQGATVNSLFQLSVQAPPELIFADGME